MSRYKEENQDLIYNLIVSHGPIEEPPDWFTFEFVMLEDIAEAYCEEILPEKRIIVHPTDILFKTKHGRMYVCSLDLFRIMYRKTSKQ